MPFDYSNLSECLQLVHTLTQGRSNDVIATVKLQESAGTLDETKYYRPYYVAAKILQQSFQDQMFTAIPDHELTNLQPIIASYLQEQLALDLLYGWDVPAPFSVEAALSGRIVRMSIDCA